MKCGKIKQSFTRSFLKHIIEHFSDVSRDILQIQIEFSGQTKIEIYAIHRNAKGSIKSRKQVLWFRSSHHMTTTKPLYNPIYYNAHSAKECIHRGSQ